MSPHRFTAPELEHAVRMGIFQTTSQFFSESDQFGMPIADANRAILMGAIKAMADIALACAHDSDDARTMAIGWACESLFTTGHAMSTKGSC